MSDKRVYWEFVAPDIIRVSDDCDDKAKEKLFPFQLVRYKDSDTHEESLKIISIVDGTENGSIVTNILDLEKDIKQLMRFGVVLNQIEFREICRRIEENYVSLNKTPVTLGNDSRLGDLIEEVKKYVRSSADYITEDDCYVPVNDFNGMASDGGYSGYEMKTLRKTLASGGYIRTTPGRYATLARIRNKPERVIAFDRKKLEVEVPEKKKDKQGE